MTDRVTKTDEEWRELLTPEQYEVTHPQGTEPPFKGKYYDYSNYGNPESYNKTRKLLYHGSEIPVVFPNIYEGKGPVNLLHITNLSGYTHRYHPLRASYCYPDRGASGP